MFFNVVSFGWVPVYEGKDVASNDQYKLSVNNILSDLKKTSIAYCSAGNPKASHPIGCKTLKPCIRLYLARISVAVYPRG